MVKTIASRQSVRKAFRVPSRMIQRKSKPATLETPLHPLLRLQQTAGNRAVGQLIQAKLKVGQPGDKYEQEADRVADAVMRMPEPQVQRQPEGDDEEMRRQPVEEEVEEEEETVRTKEASGRTSEVSSNLEANINALRGSGQPLPVSTRAFFEHRLGYDFSQVRVHTDEQAAESARAVNAQAYTVGRNVVFGVGQYVPETTVGKKLLAHELTHVLQQSTGTAKRAIQRRIRPEDVSAEMVGQHMNVTGPFTSGAIQLSGGETVIIVSWSNASTTARVQLPTPYLHALTPFDIPKRLLRPTPSGVAGIAPYGAGISQQVRSVERGEQAITRERTRPGGPRPGEIARLEGLQRRRQRLLNRRLIQETMFNRFDPVIRHWTNYYNRQFRYADAQALDPNLVKSMLFQESQMGTSGQHLEEPPTHPVKTRFNIGQVIDSSASALLVMMQEMQPALLTTYHLENIRSDLASAQRDLRTLRSIRSPTPDQAARLAELTRLSHQSWEVFLWGYRASGETAGFSEAVTEFFASVGTGLPPRNMDYEFWIRTAIRWLFEKRRGVSSWEEAIRAYNGSGTRAMHYREAVTRRAQRATSAQARGEGFVPSNI